MKRLRWREGAQATFGGNVFTVFPFIESEAYILRHEPYFGWPVVDYHVHTVAAAKRQAEKIAAEIAGEE